MCSRFWSLNRCARSLLERGKYSHLDGLRAGAVVWVILYRANLLPKGEFGVDVFFVLSGYLIGLLLSNEFKERGTINTREFLIRRWLRIGPSLVFVVAVAAVLPAWFAPENACSS